MPTIQLELVRPHPGQLQVLREARRFNVLACGRQWGKTTLAQQIVVEAVLGSKACAWFNPTYKSNDSAWESLKETLRPLVTATDEQARRIQVRGGGSAECWSLIDPDSGRGRQYDLVVIDEAGQVQKLDHAWQKSIRPMLAVRQGALWALSTPTGASHYFAVLWRQGQSLLNRQWRSWQMPTAINPAVTAAEIEAMKQDMSEQAFAQEVLAQFISWEGAVFTRLREAVLDGPPQGAAAVIGCDWAGASGTGDFTAAIVFSDRGNVLEILRTRGEPFTQQQARLKGLWERHGQPPILAEVNGMGQVLNDALRRQRVAVQDFLTSAASKTEIISKLVQGFEQGSIKIPDDEILLGELQAFQCTPLAGGQFRYSAPPGLHDDLVMALAIAYQGLGKARKQQLALSIDWSGANAELALGSGWREGAPAGEDFSARPCAPAGRARVLRERWPA
jgi:hypothetical protein